MYAAQRPFLLTSQVYFLQMGKLLRGPRKHLLYGLQSRFMIVRWRPRGSSLAQPAQGMRRLPPLILRVFPQTDIILIAETFLRKRCKERWMRRAMTAGSP